ncbi:MAG: hypothetical protein LQ342_008323 [Letrouitia transgressa]|nr:MAG: hypothetical protein LQ342_008323 [Letrouitia transgressa]
MPVLEFATVYTLPGISPKNEQFLGITQNTVGGMEGVGVSPTRFLLTAEDEKRVDQRVISMIAVWPSADVHAQFLSSGGTAEALGPLTQFITMGEAVFVLVEKAPRELELIANQSVANAIFRVKPENIEEFEKKATSVLEKQDVTISGWDIREQGESFMAAGKMVADQIGAKSGRIEGAKNWCLFAKDESVVEEVSKNTKGLFVKVDTLSWVDLID